MSTYSREDIATVLDANVRTIKEDSRFLLMRKMIFPDSASGRATYYSDADFEVFKQLREHCRKGNDRKSFTPIKNTEVVEASVVSVKPEKIKSITDRSTEEQLRYLKRSNPLFLLEILEKLQLIADNKWLIPTKYLAALFSISPRTLTRYQSYSYWGFVASKETNPIHKKNNYLPPTEDKPKATGLIVTKGVLWKVEANNQ